MAKVLISPGKYVQGAGEMKKKTVAVPLHLVIKY